MYDYVYNYFLKMVHESWQPNFMSTWISWTSKLPLCKEHLAKPMFRCVAECRWWSSAYGKHVAGKLHLFYIQYMYILHMYIYIYVSTLRDPPVFLAPGTSPSSCQECGGKYIIWNIWIQQRIYLLDYYIIYGEVIWIHIEFIRQV